jgi:hypothetical protein
MLRSYPRQFGNMLVLAATYTSHLSQLVDREKLRTLLDRTITFLLQSPMQRCRDIDYDSAQNIRATHDELLVQ